MPARKYRPIEGYEDDSCADCETRLSDGTAVVKLPCTHFTCDKCFKKWMENMKFGKCKKCNNSKVDKDFFLSILA